MLKSIIHRLGQTYQRRMLWDKYSHQRFRRHNERPVEFAFVFTQIARLAPQTVLDVGTGETALPALMANCGCVVTAIDNKRDYWAKGMSNRHWHVIDDDISATSLRGPFDLVTCISVLEHVVAPLRAVTNMLGLLRPGGHLVISCPYTEHEHIDNTYAMPGVDPEMSRLPYIARSYCRADLDQWLETSQAELVEAQYWRGYSGRHWAQGTRIAPPEPSTVSAAHNLACLLIRKLGV